MKNIITSQGDTFLGIIFSFRTLNNSFLIHVFSFSISLHLNDLELMPTGKDHSYATLSTYTS